MAIKVGLINIKAKLTKQITSMTDTVVPEEDMMLREKVMVKAIGVIVSKEIETTTKKVLKALAQ